MGPKGTAILLMASIIMSIELTRGTKPMRLQGVAGQYCLRRAFLTPDLDFGHISSGYLWPGWSHYDVYGTQVRQTSSPFLEVTAAPKGAGRRQRNCRSVSQIWEGVMKQCRCLRHSRILVKTRIDLYTQGPIAEFKLSATSRSVGNVPPSSLKPLIPCCK